MNREYLIDFVTEHYDNAPNHLKIAFNKEPIHKQSTVALQYFYDWTIKGFHKRSKFVERGEYIEIDNVE